MLKVKLDCKYTREGLRKEATIESILVNLASGSVTMETLIYFQNPRKELVFTIEQLEDLLEKSKQLLNHDFKNWMLDKAVNHNEISIRQFKSIV
jgi:hypothetical protein